MNSFETDPVAQALQRLYQATTATVVAPEVEVIVGRARAHRRTNAVLTGFAVIAVVVLGLVVSGPLRASRSLPPMPPASSDPTPTVSATPQDGRVLVNLPLTLALPWSTLLRPSPTEWWQAGTPTPCIGAPVDAYAVGGAVGDPDAPLEVQIAIYADETAARAAFGEVRSDAQACIGHGEGQRVPTAEPIGDEGFSLEFPKGADGAGEMAGMAVRVLAFRVGEILALLSSEPNYKPDFSGLVEAATMQTVRAAALDVLPRLGPCDDVCPRPADLRSPVDQLTEGDQAWLVALDAFPAGQVSAEVLRTAVRLGYHPMVVSRGCDLGVEFIEGRLDTTRYVALYFATSSEANAVVAAASVLLPDTSDGFPRAQEVTTLCVA